jgi:glucosamine--fructose-6-phosphate aminotransferase (isomerizing)
MCGIVGYIGKRQAYKVVIGGLRRLEYRGYDSAGVALSGEGAIHIYKCRGKVDDLEKFSEKQDRSGHVGIGHTRWATHGEPNDVNAHPHACESGSIALVHNGIIENYAALKTELEKKGHVFASETDTEAVSHLIEETRKTSGTSFPAAVKTALYRVVGAYALAILSRDDPDTLVVAKKGSPLVIGIGEKEFFIASDATPIVEYTKRVVYLEDGEMAVLGSDGSMKIMTIEEGGEKVPRIEEIEWEADVLAKEGFTHFMEKEIFEQPKTIRDSMRGRLLTEGGSVRLGGLRDHLDRIAEAPRITFIACGTSWHAGLVAKYLIERLAQIPVDVEYASEFRYRHPLVGKGDVVFAISQSGETADTLAAIKQAKENGASVFGICNVVGSSIARETEAGVYTHAGPEIGVASTKAFTAQVTVLSLIAIALGRQRGVLSGAESARLVVELDAIPDKIAAILKQSGEIKTIAEVFASATDVLFIGRGTGFPTALEGALKLKEISYIHAEGYPAGELKHGPIALIDEHVPVVAIATRAETEEKTLSNIQEVRTRGGKVLVIVTEGDEAAMKIADWTIAIPACDELLTPLLASIPLQLLAYHVAVARGANVDQPRNLAKSVTVE